ncbi:TIGR01459 family HAD-type hydrolase [Nitrospirillum pindoramense]|uniref:HAD superfamily hydrolase (TIGR01459 family) n=1 Tax=Nitrospirillum amazonense TaxID=28077 RepID=A0A560H6E3_9PROT|nr:TIGR01459 family HAD-type hydrolase [Nitrospirillum amazonense]TWB41886.1 HAD superfamily hydrolase (TIGR01459 family) [Nitrospirillum amazonense]
MTAIPLHTGLSHLADRYDGFILDLWGVVHDGIAPYPGVPECLKTLRARGKRVCLLSNAPRRVDAAADRLTEMGLTPDHYDALLTSGEATHDALRDPPDAWHAALGPTLLHIGPDRDAGVYLDLPGRIKVDRPEDADFVLNTGIVDFSESLTDYEPILAACAALKLPMVCANPDLVVHVGPQLVICAGELARRYEELGGDVRQHGKPYPGVYARCFDLLGDIPRQRILAVGDSLRTDMAGANAAGIDGLLITGGIHREELGVADPLADLPDLDRLAEIAARAGLTISGAMNRLGW